MHGKVSGKEKGVSALEMNDLPDDSNGLNILTYYAYSMIKNKWRYGIDFQPHM